MGHATEIITVDVYGDTKEIIKDCTDELEPFIEEVKPIEEEISLIDLTEELAEINLFTDNFLQEIEKEDTRIKDYSIEVKNDQILDEFWEELKTVETA